MKWFLILWVTTSGGADHMLFYSRAACEAARASVQTEDTRDGKYTPTIRSVCVSRSI